MWEEYDDEGDSFHTFSILTTPSNGLVSTVSDRQPFILTLEQEMVWITKDAEESELLSILNSSNEIDFDGFTVSPQLNTISFDRPSLVLPVPAADQFGNLTLFD